MERTDMDEDYYAYIKMEFSKLAPVYDVVDIFLSGVRKKAADLADIENNSRILDVATGTGKQAFAFAKIGHEVVGIDMSEDMLNVAKKKNGHANVNFLAADAARMPFEDSRFDASCISLALHEMPLNIREKVLSEMARVTKPKGKILIADYAPPKSNAFGRLVCRIVKSYETAYYPEFITSDLEGLLEKSGIRIERALPILFGAGMVLKGTNKKIK
ncbi:MAG: class I SAM-dependent methyltransferase [Thermoplasmata archaeon HGW-Thermoplasmata-2]|nr:MAG: class I SAM-dependent methyltransferase [Thermoplasmata archaeon HGW-Thermoplasmata-2]